MLAVRPYCHTDHYWQVYFDTNKVIRETCGAAGYALAERLPIYPRFVAEAGWLDRALRPRVEALAAGDPDRFLAYFIAALQTAAPALGRGAAAALDSPQSPPPELILTALVNEIAAAPDAIVLVLDDYHALEGGPVDQALTFLLDHLPPQLHLVVVTREDPPLPLARLRARGQLTELRAADLRFTPDEAAEFLNQVMGLSLSPAELAALEARTEGWIAGLQLAALSMQGRSDTAAFVEAFTGSHRFVLDYLVEEVLLRQPERVRTFLLQTSILGRLCGPLCAAVTGQQDSGAVLAELERGNLFVVPLDDQRAWLRYHHLFADVLRARLVDERAGQVSELHRRASDWFERNDLPAEAIEHALLARDVERAAALIEMVWLDMDLKYQTAPWLRWAQQLPDEVIKVHPVLCLGYAWALPPAWGFMVLRSLLAVRARPKAAMVISIIMVILGTLIGGIVIAMYLPIFKMGSVM